MPELPDVEVFRRDMSRLGVHREISDVEIFDQAMLRDVSARALTRTLRGDSLVRAHRHGKHLLGEISNGSWLVLHFGMTGRLSSEAPDGPDSRHARFRLHFRDQSRLTLVDQRRLGFIGLAEDLEEYVAQHALGPDVLSLTQSELHETLRPWRGGLKAGLMEQSLIAGIGNVYSDEILFQARLHPRASPYSLDPSEWRRLHTQTRRVLTMAADRGADPARMPRTWLLPNRVESVPCPRGRGSIEKARIAGRGAFFCPACQRQGG